MVLVKILKRRDASSVLVAILLAMIIQQPLMSTTGWIASKISYTHNGPFGYAPGGSWKDQYLFPIVWAITQIIVLEILGWIYVYGSRPFTRKRR